MRWDHLAATATPAAPTATGAERALPLLPDAVVRRFDTPHFRGITFYEVQARSILNRVPKASRVPFDWTINPYRGCSHACVYCFARNTHTYLDFDAGRDFDSQIVVKVNAEEVLRRELARPSWRREHVAMGTNVDPYQRAEGRYRLMRGILGALSDHANPFSILTKSALVTRDLDLLTEAQRVTDVAVNLSIGFVDPAVWRTVEPGTPSPQRRLDVVRRLADAGVPCGVLMAPVLPHLTDSEEQLDAAVGAIVRAGAGFVSPIVLHLRPGAREWFLQWLGREHPQLVGAYQRLYGGRAYAPAHYQQRIADTVRRLARAHGLRPLAPRDTRLVTPPRDEQEERQLALL